MEADSAGPDRPFNCDFCPKKYLRKNNLEDHILMEHPDTDQILAEIGNLHVNDDVCRTKGRPGQGRSRVAKRATDIMKYKARNGRSKGSLIIECEICSKKFRYQSDLKNHYESHFRGRGRTSRVGGAGRNSATSPRGTPKGNISPKEIGAPEVEPSPAARGYSPRGSYRPRGANLVKNGDGSVNRTRPCLYCGKTFLRLSDLQVHEQAEAIDFEKDAMSFEHDSKVKINQSMFESHNQFRHQLIDRTDEEFGDDYRFPQNLKLDLKPSSASGRMGAITDVYVNFCQLPSTSPANGVIGNHVISNNSAFSAPPHPPPVKPQYNNHTSQYTSLDPLCPVYPGNSSLVQPPPAHEDPTTLHGFFPPPPPLPVPQFSQVGNKRSDVEFPDPNEAKTYTRLQSNDESQTRSSLLHVNSKSPSREVLDLSLPKHTDSEPVVNSVLETTEPDETLLAAKSLSDSSVHSVHPDSSLPKQEEKSLHNEHVDNIDPDPGKQIVKQQEMILFEPSSMPSMPEANISCSESLLSKPEQPPDIDSGDGNTIAVSNSIDSEWKSLSDDYSGLINPDEDIIDSFRSQSPLQFDDPNRIDCKFCGIIFSAPHVRKFHETSHEDEQEEYDGELWENIQKSNLQDPTREGSHR